MHENASLRRAVTTALKHVTPVSRRVAREIDAVKDDVLQFSDGTPVYDFFREA